MRHWAGAAALLVLLATGPAFAETRVCSTVTLDETFVMPDGSEHPPGKLTLCRGQAYTPSQAMYVSYVDRAPVGMVFSRRGLSEAPTDRDPFMMFARDGEGRLHLYGLAVPCREGMETFRFERFPFRARKADEARSFPLAS